jgi:hypothetical protein
LAPLSLGIYLALCLLVGWLGRARRVGTIGFFILSLLFTPLIMALVLLISAPRRGKA